METVNLIKLKVEDNKYHVTSKKKSLSFFFSLTPILLFSAGKRLASPEFAAIRPAYCRTKTTNKPGPKRTNCAICIAVSRVKASHQLTQGRCNKVENKDVA